MINHYLVKNIKIICAIKTIRQLFTISIALLSFLTFSQDGSADQSFGIGGVVQTDIQGGDDIVRAIAQQNNGNLIVAGQADFGGVYYPTLVCYLPDGTLDGSFGTNGVVWNDYGGLFDIYRDVITQEDDKIIAGGYVGPGGNKPYTLTRYLPNGVIDNSFGANGDLVPFPSGSLVSDVIILDNENILIAGSILNNHEIALKRYFPDGAIDTSFGTNGIVTTLIGNESNLARNIELMDNGNIVLGGKIEHNGVAQNILIRYFPNGDMDTFFGDNGVANILIDEEYSCTHKLYSDGRIGLSCLYINYIDEYVESRLLRYLSNGEFDSSFGDGGYINSSGLLVGGLIIQENQRLLVYGVDVDFFEGGGYLRMKRYFAGGGTDSSFQYNPIYPEIDSASATLIQNDGKIVVAGNSMWYSGSVDFVLQRFNNNPLAVPEYNLNNLKVYPNPSLGNFTIEHDFIVGADIPYHITDVSGKVLQKGVLTGNRTIVDFSAAASGIYLLSTSTQTIRLIKE